jgi:hypothetical protein
MQIGNARETIRYLIHFTSVSSSVSHKLISELQESTCLLLPSVRETDPKHKSQRIFCFLRFEREIQNTRVNVSFTSFSSRDKSKTQESTCVSLLLPSVQQTDPRQKSQRVFYFLRFERQIQNTRVNVYFASFGSRERSKTQESTCLLLPSVRQIQITKDFRGSFISICFQKLGYDEEPTCCSPMARCAEITPSMLLLSVTMSLWLAAIVLIIDSMVLIVSEIMSPTQAYQIDKLTRD